MQRRPRLLAAAAAGVLGTVLMFAASATIVAAWYVAAWYGVHVRVCIVAFVIGAVLSHLAFLAADVLAAPARHAGGNDPATGETVARRIRAVLEEMAADVYLAADDPAHYDPAVPPIRAVAVADVERALDGLATR